MAFIYKMAQIHLTCTQKTSFKILNLNIYSVCMWTTPVWPSYIYKKSSKHQVIKRHWAKILKWQDAWMHMTFALIFCNATLLGPLYSMLIFHLNTKCQKSPKYRAAELMPHCTAHFFFLFPSQLSFLVRFCNWKKKKNLSHKAAACSGIHLLVV